MVKTIISKRILPLESLSVQCVTGALCVLGVSFGFKLAFSGTAVTAVAVGSTIASIITGGGFAMIAAGIFLSGAIIFGGLAYWNYRSQKEAQESMAKEHVHKTNTVEDTDRLVRERTNAQNVNLNNAEPVAEKSVLNQVENKNWRQETRAWLSASSERWKKKMPWANFLPPRPASNRNLKKENQTWLSKTSNDWNKRMPWSNFLPPRPKSINSETNQFSVKRKNSFS